MLPNVHACCLLLVLPNVAVILHQLRSRSLFYYPSSSLLLNGCHTAYSGNCRCYGMKSSPYSVGFFSCPCLYTVWAKGKRLRQRRFDSPWLWHTINTNSWSQKNGVITSHDSWPHHHPQKKKRRSRLKSVEMLWIPNCSKWPAKDFPIPKFLQPIPTQRSVRSGKWSSGSETLISQHIRDTRISPSRIALHPQNHNSSQLKIGLPRPKPKRNRWSSNHPFF